MTKHVVGHNVIAVLTLLASSMALDAAQLKQETLQAWDQYVAKADSEMAARLEPGASFLRSAENPDTLARLRAGEIVVGPVGHNPKRIADGLIHHWTGAAFIPNTTITDIFTVVRDYAEYKHYYGPLVIDSKPLGHTGDEYRFTMLMMNKSLFSSSALDGEYFESYLRVSDSRWYSVAYSTRIQEIDHVGRKDEIRLPPDEGGGYIWRLYTFSRFEQRDGGVYVELDAIALSRDIPGSLRWLIDPIVRRLSRDSLSTSLEKTRAAVVTEATSASRARGGTQLARHTPAEGK